MSETNSQSIYPPLSIGVVTHKRAKAFSKLLQHLRLAVEQYPSSCELVVANNSGKDAHDLIVELLDASGIGDACEYRVLDGTENSISIGRNLILDNARHPHLAFIDDDEYPMSHWLTSLVECMHDYQCALVAGPIVPIFPEQTPLWIKTVDVHNTQGLHSGDSIDYASSGNFLMTRDGVEDLRFEARFGRTGGEDTDFFLRLKDKGLQMRWSEQSVVYEDIPPCKATAQRMIHRFMSQGRIYRTIREARGEIGSFPIFALRAATLSCLALTIGGVLLLIRPRLAGNWLKRGFANLGKIRTPEKPMYSGYGEYGE